MRRKLAATVTAVAAVGLPAAGCGPFGESAEDKIQSAQEIVTDWLSAVQGKDYETACSLMAERPKGSWEQDCPDRYLPRYATVFKDAEVVEGGANVTGNLVDVLAAPVGGRYGSSFSVAGKPRKTESGGTVKSGGQFTVVKSGDTVSGCVDGDWCITATPIENADSLGLWRPGRLLDSQKELVGRSFTRETTLLAESERG